ncbi:MAG: hypothetical protein COV37_13610 [Bdellovibrio sp. CG11_big_fil_rev_8_21_14_0_20_39_38]|nr:MAG: hypothetical protein COW78_14125 [Bdellovibrio sp. CG22_combo_CG10-13_8_21_14_all_39_27]PIR34143.1 MAG: hypothetical protein COV37_13610 [Bdellovibrio sp. CG11_big_fil_rev_8_21_14_0_20_39_38]
MIGKLSSKEGVVNVLVSWLPLEDNWYARILDENLTILSLYETGDILLANHIKLENFVIKNILKLSAIYCYCGNSLSTKAYGLAHDQIRKCLFDMNYDKSDIVFNTNSAQLCSECDANFDRVNLPEDFKKNLKKDLKKLKKDFFYRVYDFVQTKPKISIVIATIFALFINILSNYLYEIIMGRANLPIFLVSPFVVIWNYFT